MELTKSAKKSLAILYKEYCQRVKSGVCKADARRIRAGEYPEELLDDLKELREVGAVKVDIGKNVEMRKRIGGRIESARRVRRMTQAKLAEELTKIIYLRLWTSILTSAKM